MPHQAAVGWFARPGVQARLRLRPGETLSRPSDGWYNEHRKDGAVAGQKWATEIAIGSSESKAVRRERAKQVKQAGEDAYHAGNRLASLLCVDFRVGALFSRKRPRCFGQASVPVARMKKRSLAPPI